MVRGVWVLVFLSSPEVLCRGCGWYGGLLACGVGVYWDVGVGWGVVVMGVIGCV